MFHMMRMLKLLLLLGSLAGLMLVQSAGANLQSRVLLLDDGYKEIVHAYCPHGGGKQLTMFGLTSDGSKVNIFSLTSQDEILQHSVSLDPPGQYISVTESCRTALVTQRWAVTTFDPQYPSHKEKLFTVELVGKAIATDKAYAVGFIVSQVQEFRAYLVCVNLTNSYVKNCTNCHTLHWSEDHEVRTVSHPTGDWMYVYDLDAVYKVKLEDTCVREIYKLETTDVFGSNDSFFVNEGKRIMNTNGSVFLVSESDTYRYYDLFPDGGFHGLNESSDGNRSMYSSINQYPDYPHTVFAIREGKSEILAFSWPELTFIREISVPPLYLSTGARSTSHTPISVHVDHLNGPHQLHVVSRYIVEGRTRYGLAYIHQDSTLTSDPIMSAGKYIKDTAEPELGLYQFAADSYDEFDLCVGGGTRDTPPIVAYKHDVVVFFDKEFSFIREPIRLGHVIEQMAFEPTCKKVAFSHGHFVTIMSMTTGTFYTLASTVQHPSSLVYASIGRVMVFPHESSLPAVFCLDLGSNATRSCSCGEHRNTLAVRSDHQGSVYTLSRGLSRQVLAKFIEEPSSCVRKTQEKPGRNTGYYGNSLWVNPDDKLLILSDGRILTSENLTQVGVINDRFPTEAEKYLSFAMLPQERDVVMGALRKESFIIIYEHLDWPGLQAVSYVYVQSGCAENYQPIHIRYSSQTGKLLVVSNITEYTGRQTTGLAWVDVSVSNRHLSLDVILNKINTTATCQRNIINPWWRTRPQGGRNDWFMKSTRRSRTLTSTGGWWGSTTQPWWRNASTTDMPVTGSSSDSSSIGATRSWRFYASVFGVSLLVITVVVTVGLTLGFTVCRRRPPHSIMTNPLLGAMVTQPETAATDHDQQDTATQLDSAQSQGANVQTNDSTRQTSYGSHCQGHPPQRSSQGYVIQNQGHSSQNPALTFYQPYQQVSNSHGLMRGAGPQQCPSQAVYFLNQPVQAVTEQDISQSDHGLPQEVEQNSIQLKLGQENFGECLA